MRCGTRLVWYLIDGADSSECSGESGIPTLAIATQHGPRLQRDPEVSMLEVIEKDFADISGRRLWCNFSSINGIFIAEEHRSILPPSSLISLFLQSGP